MANRPKPTHLKIVEGTDRADRRNAREPQPPKITPDVPPWLSDTGKVYWGRFSVILEGMGVLTLADSLALERLVQTYIEVRELEHDVRINGRILHEKNVKGDIATKPNPSVGMLNSADIRLRQMMIEFGLTPAARTRVQTVKGGGQAPRKPVGKQKNAADEFFAQR